MGTTEGVLHDTGNSVDVVLFDHLQHGWDSDGNDLSCCSHKPAQLLYERKVLLKNKIKKCILFFKCQTWVSWWLKQHMIWFSFKWPQQWEASDSLNSLTCLHAGFKDQITCKDVLFTYLSDTSMNYTHRCSYLTKVFLISKM